MWQWHYWIQKQYISHFRKVFHITTSKTVSNQSTHTKTSSAFGANLSPIRQWNLTFLLGNKHFTHSFIALQDLWWNVIGLNWQCNYKIGCNWNVNGQQYITHNNKYLYTSTASSDTKPIIYSAGAIHLQLRYISVITVQALTELNTQHMDDLLPGLIPLAVDHRIHHKYPKLLSIPILNTAYDAVYITRTTMIGTLYPIENEAIEVNDVSRTKTRKNKVHFLNGQNKFYFYASFCHITYYGFLRCEGKCSSYQQVGIVLDNFILNKFFYSFIKVII